MSREELGHLFGSGQLALLVVDGVEHGVMHALLDTHGLQRDEQLPVNIPDAAEQRRDTHEVDVGRQRLDPRIEGRFELVAVRAAIPEQLDHLDLARLRYRYRVAQLLVLATGFDVLGLGVQAQQAEAGEGGTENQVTHAELLENEGRADTAVRFDRQCSSGFRHCSGSTNEKGWP